MYRGFANSFMNVTSRHSFTLFRPFLLKKALFWGVNGFTKFPQTLQIMPPCIFSSPTLVIWLWSKRPCRSSWTLHGGAGRRTWDERETLGAITLTSWSWSFLCLSLRDACQCLMRGLMIESTRHLNKSKSDKRLLFAVMKRKNYQYSIV